MRSSSNSEEVSSEEVRYTGRVKWFNIKHGYGFITPVGRSVDIVSDVFVHHTSITVGSEQYTYLVEGEYVEYSLDYNVKSENDSHQYHASDVTGIARGSLMCETRFAGSRENPKTRREPQDSSKTLRRPPRLSSRDPVDSPKTPRAPRNVDADGFELPRQKRLTRQSSAR